MWSTDPPLKKRSQKRKPEPNASCTNQTEEIRIELSVSGFVRRFESPNDDAQHGFEIPRSLVELIIQFHERDWMFIHRDEYITDGAVRISEDGQSASINSKTYASIQYGPFWGSGDRMIYQFRVRMGSPPQCGVGFISQTFTSFLRTGWNNGEPGSMCLYTNGYNPIHKDLNVGNKGKTTSKMLNDGSDWLDNIGDEVIIKINTDLMEALIWNETKLKIGDLDFNTQYAMRSRRLFKMKLPKEFPLALIFEMGFKELTTTVIERKFTKT